MRVLIDWLTWTVHRASGDVSEVDAFAAFRAAVATESGGLLRVEGDPAPRVRRPYTYAAALDVDAGLLLWNPALSYATVELSGRSLAALDADDAVRLVGMVANTVTRVDLAIDIATDELPFDVVDAGYSGRIRTVSRVDSPTGQTVYLGSPKSDRMARIYVYRDGPRAGLLRFEFVARRTQAKAVASAIAAGASVVDAVSGMAQHYRLQTPLLEDLTNAAHVQAAYSDRQTSKTKRWLLRQVRPALLRLHDSGDIDDAFIMALLEGIWRPSGSSIPF